MKLQKIPLLKLKELSKKKNIKTLYFEIYYGYIKRLNEIRDYFDGVEIRFRMGMETFDNGFRIGVYNKNFKVNEKDLEF